MSDTELLEWMIESGAYVSYSLGEWIVFVYIGEGECDRLGVGPTAREAIQNAAKGEQQ